MEEKWPKFISTFPRGEDKFLGSSHDNIAKSICSIIINQSDDIKKKIIGLEGNWGSGKSNIIKILQKEETGYLGNENYIHFVFDAWAHQEDLNRRALLEELIDYLELKKIIPETEEWKSNKNSLKGKTVNSVKSILPQVKLYWIYFITSFLLFKFLERIYPYFKSIDFIISKHYDSIVKEIIFIWSPPFVLFYIGLYYLILELIRVFEDNDSNLTLEQSLGQVFYIINGKEVKTNTTDFIIEDEPSNRQFRYFFGKINNVLQKQNKILVLTIDNIDRLSKDKVKALWSTINIFFAESISENYDNVWLIIPYDESKVVKSFAEEVDLEIGKGLIDKTFALKFRVTPPLLSNWEDLLINFLKDAFGVKIDEDVEESHFLKRIFDNYNSDLNIKPRQIVNYVNDIVTLKIQYPEIKLRYLALFSMTKDFILNNDKKNPSQIILDKSYLNPNSKLLFNNDNELYKYITSIAFGVSLDEAEEVIYDREIYIIVKEAKIDNLDRFKNLPTFSTIFEKKFSDLDFSEMVDSNIDKIPDLLKRIEELNLITFSISDKYWQDLTRKLINSDYLNKVFRAIHKKITKKDLNLGKMVLQRCIDEMYNEVRSEDSEIKYVENLSFIKSYLIDEKIDFKLSDFNFISRNIQPESYLKLLKLFPEDYTVLNLECQNFINHFYREDGSVDIESIHRNKELIVLMDNDKLIVSLFDFIKVKFKENIQNGLFINLNKYYESLKSLSKDDNFLEDISIPLAVINDEIQKAEDGIDRDNVLTFILFSLKYSSNLKQEVYSNIFEKFKVLNSNDSEMILYKDIEYFISYQELIDFTLENFYAEIQLIKRIINKLTEDKELGRELNILECLSKLDEINKIVFENNFNLEKSFYLKLSDWNDYFLENLEENIKSIERISETSIKFALKFESKLSTTIIDKLNDYFISRTKEDYYEIFNKKESFITISFKLLLKEKLREDILRNHFYPYFKLYLIEFAEGQNDVMVNNYYNLYKILDDLNESDRKHLLSTITKALNHNKKISYKQLSFFAKYLFENKTLFENPDDSINGILQMFIKDWNLYNEYFKTNYRIFIDLVGSSKKSKALGKQLLRSRLKFYPKEGEIRKYANRKIPGWNKN